MEDDGVVVAALGEGGKVGAGLRDGLLVEWDSKGKRWGVKVGGKGYTHPGGMICVEFEGYGALGGNEYGLLIEVRSLANHGGVKDDVGSHCDTNGPLLDSTVGLVHLRA